MTTSRSTAPDPGRKPSQMTFAANVVQKAIGLQSVRSGARQRSNPAAGAFHKVNILAGTRGPIPRGGPGTKMTIRGPETDGMGSGTGVLDLMDPKRGFTNPTGTGPSQGHLAAVTNTDAQVKCSRGLARYQSHSPAVAGAPGSHAPRQRPLRGGQSGSLPYGLPGLTGQQHRTPEIIPGRSQGREALCAPWDPSACRQRPRPWECGTQLVRRRHLCHLAVKERGSPPIVPRARPSPCIYSRGTGRQCVPVTWRLRGPGPMIPGGLSVRLPWPPHRAWSTWPHLPPTREALLPSPAHAQRHAHTPAHTLMPAHTQRARPQ